MRQIYLAFFWKSWLYKDSGFFMLSLAILTTEAEKKDNEFPYSRKSYQIIRNPNTF